MRAAQQQRWHFDFTAINRIHVPVALASMLLAAILFGQGVLRRPLDDLTLLAGTITSAVLDNAFICSVNLARMIVTARAWRGLRPRCC